MTAALRALHNEAIAWTMLVIAPDGQQARASAGRDRAYGPRAPTWRGPALGAQNRPYSVTYVWSELACQLGRGGVDLAVGQVAQPGRGIGQWVEAVAELHGRSAHRFARSEVRDRA